MDMFENLPDEIVLAILSFLDPEDVAAVGLTCRRVYLIAQDPM
jgi:F-box associated protein